jgi:3-oxoacyl-[acyl-carrier-protein] synthase-1
MRRWGLEEEVKKLEMTTKQWVKITPEGVEVSGEPLTTAGRGAALLTEVYRAKVNDYPKFFKMDELSKLGFLATELLLQAEGDRHSESDDRAVILFGRCGSLACDRKYQQTIERLDDFFPSPSIFVYTLPNIVTGEIAIRNHYYGETAFYAMAHCDEQLIRQTIEASLLDPATQSVICGWVDCESDHQFEANVKLIYKE